ncbi:unnamed protein product [Ostreobium quekettii]|uniref:Cytochrome b561 domain-containing protein n=1 Tax=Ostreobium quekettii TaxID=121088 RepID=A0A8S1JAP4_9CHLO|nr:unnamed protein product [Ostreobium quekettii]
MFLMLASLVTVMLTFEKPFMAEGRLHKYCGIGISSLLGVQIAMGLLRPSSHHRLRWVYELCHHWLGRILLVAGTTVASLGVNALKALFDDSITGWVSVLLRGQSLVLACVDPV